MKNFKKGIKLSKKRDRLQHQFIKLVSKVQKTGKYSPKLKELAEKLEEMTKEVNKLIFKNEAHTEE